MVTLTAKNTGVKREGASKKTVTDLRPAQTPLREAWK